MLFTYTVQHLGLAVWMSKLVIFSDSDGDSQTFLERHQNLVFKTCGNHYMCCGYKHLTKFGAQIKCKQSSSSQMNREARGKSQSVKGLLSKEKSKVRHQVARHYMVFELNGCSSSLGISVLSRYP